MLPNDELARLLEPMKSEFITHGSEESCSWVRRYEVNARLAALKAHITELQHENHGVLTENTNLRAERACEPDRTRKAVAAELRETADDWVIEYMGEPTPEERDIPKPWADKLRKRADELAPPEAPCTE